MEYQEGKIYKICGGGMTYYGSTINKLNIRFNKHKNDLNCSSKIIIETGEAIIELVELFSCETLDELLWRERWYIDNNECVNIVLPIVTEKERKEYRKQWYLDNKEEHNIKTRQDYIKNKEQIDKRHKQYDINNKEKIKEWREKKFTCDCGSICSVGHKAHHNKTKKHINYLDANLKYNVIIYYEPVK